MRMENFIPPGMFTFCGRCGLVCAEGARDFMCLRCRKTLLGIPVPPETEGHEERRSRVVFEVRRSVAQTLSRFLPELWWVKSAATTVVDPQPRREEA